MYHIICPDRLALGSRSRKTEVIEHKLYHHIVCAIRMIHSQNRNGKASKYERMGGCLQEGKNETMSLTHCLSGSLSHFVIIYVHMAIT